MLVREVMTDEVVTVPVDATLEGAVERMVRNRIGCVVVEAEGEAVGIVTERDVLIAGHRTGRRLEEIDVEGAMSRPVITIGPEATLRAAVDRMKQEGIKKLPVTDDLALVGILTQQDLAFAQPELVKEAIHMEERRQQWERERD